MSKKIVLVEDERNLNDLIRSYLEKEKYEVFAYDNAEDAIECIGESIHLWILDIMLPGKSGYELMAEVKSITPKVPIILISARDQDFDKIIGLEKGADDYIAKPFSPKELLLRVKKIIERCYVTNELINIGGYTIDSDGHKVYDNNQLLDLSNREYILLMLLYSNMGKPFTRDEILNHVWDRDYFGNDRVVDDLVRRLRKKMPRLQVETIYGYGYRLEDYEE